MDEVRQGQRDEDGDASWVNDFLRLAAAHAVLRQRYEHDEKVRVLPPAVYRPEEDKSDAPYFGHCQECGKTD